MSSFLRPSYAQGFARSAGESENPELWDGLAGVWAPFLGPTGDSLHDVSAYQNHGTLTLMDPATDWVQSPHGWALDLDGANDLIVVPESPRLALGRALSVLIRFRFAASPADWDLLAIKSTGSSWTDGWGIFYRSNTVKFFVNHYGVNRAQVTLSASSRDWHTLIGTWDGSTIRLFLDGAEGTPATYAGPPTSSSDNLTFGGGEFGSGNRIPVQFNTIMLASAGWSSGAVYRLTHDPYALFRPRRRVRGVIAAIGGPYRVAAGGAWHTGAAAGQAFHTGQTAGQIDGRCG